MHAARDFDFSVSMLDADRWIITAQSSDGIATVLAGVYISAAAAHSALPETSKRWLGSRPGAEQNAIAA